jgi:hypothetical protein
MLEEHIARLVSQGRFGFALVALNVLAGATRQEGHEPPAWVLDLDRKLRQTISGGIIISDDYLYPRLNDYVRLASEIADRLPALN